jgi:hypothetical protein
MKKKYPKIKFNARKVYLFKLSDKRKVIIENNLDSSITIFFYGPLQHRRKLSPWNRRRYHCGRVSFEFYCALIYASSARYIHRFVGTSRIYQETRCRSYKRSSWSLCEIKGNNAVNVSAVYDTEYYVLDLICIYSYMSFRFRSVHTNTVGFDF